MVFGDYELIHTKRVVADRRSKDPLTARVNAALGGYNTLFYTLFFGYVGASYGGLKAMEFIPGRQIFSKAGFKQYASRAGLYGILPLSFGFVLGVSAFGDVKEYKKLRRHFRAYNAEIQNYKNELFYQ